MQAVAPVPSRTRPAAPVACGAIASAAASSAASTSRACARNSTPAAVGVARRPTRSISSHAEALLELAHLQADRRLADAEPRGGGGEALLLDDVREGAELVEIEPAHPQVFLMQCITISIFIYSDRAGQFGG